MQTLGERIKEARKESGENQNIFSKNIGISTRSLAYYENDEKEPSISSLKKISDHCSISVEWLINGNSSSNTINGNNSISETGDNSININGNVNISIDRKQKIEELNELVSELPTSTINDLISQIKNYIQKIPKMFLK